MNRRLMGNESGFTLIELMVVILILGLLAGTVMPKLIGRAEDAKRTQAAVQIRNMESALQLFHLDNGFYPSTEQGLDALVARPGTGRVPARWREEGYLEKGQIPRDPWGNEYVYLSPGTHNPDFDLRSLGADGAEGGEGKDADIENWNLSR